MGCIWSAETGFGSHPDHKRSRPPTSTVLDVLSTVSAREGYRSVRVSWYARFIRVRSNNLSTQLRRTRTSSTESPPVSTTVADPKRSADSEQIRVATIALHTKHEDSHHHRPLLCAFQLLYCICLYVLFCLPFCWCPCMAINVSVQYDGGFLPDIILLTQCYYHRGTRLNAMKRFCIFSY